MPRANLEPSSLLAELTDAPTIRTAEPHLPTSSPGRCRGGRRRWRPEQVGLGPEMKTADNKRERDRAS